MREHSERRGKDERADLNTRGPGDEYKERNYKRDARDFDGGDPALPVIVLHAMYRWTDTP